jgi:hypothetical protein
MQGTHKHGATKLLLPCQFPEFAGSFYVFVTLEWMEVVCTGCPDFANPPVQGSIHLKGLQHPRGWGRYFRGPDAGPGLKNGSAFTAAG